MEHMHRSASIVSTSDALSTLNFIAEDSPDSEVQSVLSNLILLELSFNLLIDSRFSPFALLVR